MKNILITGHNGYIGPHMIEVLRKKNKYQIYGCDINFYKDSAWRALPSPDISYNTDFRNLTLEELSKIHTVIHLAAISNDPMGELDPEITLNINAKGTIDFAKKCKLAGVSRFLMSSSCSIYGKSDIENMSETDLTEPLTTYAKSKIYAENEMLMLNSDDFCISFLRNSTAYGDSPNLRIDLVVNNFLACGISSNEIRIMSDGTPWRPLIHCRDIANAFLLFVEASSNLINGQIVNIGSNNQNFQVKDVADIAQEILPNCKVIYTGEAINDSRDYKVNFDKFTTLFPNFIPEYELKSGMIDLVAKMIEFNFSQEHFLSDQFYRLNVISKKLNLLS
jgi:nucleoside-diphosphate-sugar epimerase